MALPTPDIQAYLNNNPNILLDYVKSNTTTLLDSLETADIQQFIDKITESPPFNFVDTPAFTAVGVNFTPFLLAGLVVPLLFVTLLMVVMKNCYGSVFIFLWISVIVIWLGLNAILFSRTYPFQAQINMASKYVLISISALFVILTAIGILLRILSFPFKMLSAPSAPEPYYQAPAAPVAEVPQPTQQGGAPKRKAYPRMIYIDSRHLSPRT